ncbi:hypothetical protein [Oceanobacillus salinisoli]|uniref:hypothetical protein n=1 Tax=Oceanobacillus salinisoli TaxID=2678611 RepID=UPI0012E29347|nr:hypothetical protein [Oceanobacillus salinisoli]
MILENGTCLVHHNSFFLIAIVGGYLSGKTNGIDFSNNQILANSIQNYLLVALVSSISIFSIKSNPKQEDEVDIQFGE